MARKNEGQRAKNKRINWDKGTTEGRDGGAEKRVRHPRGTKKDEESNR